MGYQQERRDAADRRVLGQAYKAGYSIRGATDKQGGDKPPYYAIGPDGVSFAGPFDSWFKASVHVRASFRAHDSAWASGMPELSHDDIVKEYVRRAYSNNSDSEIKAFLKRMSRDRAADERASEREMRAAERKRRAAKPGPTGFALLNQIRNTRLAKKTKVKKATSAPTHAASTPATSRWGRPGSVAELYKRLIMDARLNNEEVHAAVVAQLGKQKAGPPTYAAWYRNWLKKHGHKPPTSR
jgi:hypothetical protein